MTAIREWAAALCAAGIACALLRMLSLKGPVRRTFHTLTALFFFAGLILPLGSLGEWFGGLTASFVSQEVPTALADTVDEQVQTVLSQALLADAQERLETYGITVKKVDLIRDNSRTDGIYIERVRITLDRADHPVDHSVVQALERTWGRVVEVQYDG